MGSESVIDVELVGVGATIPLTSIVVSGIDPAERPAGEKGDRRCRPV
jgi:hypothetical protein